jgi:hypothetical protein
VSFLSLDGCVPNDTSQQQNTHIGEPGGIYYAWHPWYERKVRLHATLVKRGRAVGRCSLEDVQPFRILDVPLWMMDPAVCSKIRAASSRVASVESLRELKALLRPERPVVSEFAIQARPAYLLDAGGADVSAVESNEVHPMNAVCGPPSETGMAGTVPRC